MSDKVDLEIGLPQEPILGTLLKHERCPKCGNAIQYNGNYFCQFFMYCRWAHIPPGEPGHDSEEGERLLRDCTATRLEERKSKGGHLALLEGELKLREEEPDNIEDRVWPQYSKESLEMQIEMLWQLVRDPS